MINSQLLLYIQVGFAILFLIYFVLGRPRAKHLKLDLKSKSNDNKSSSPSNEQSLDSSGHELNVNSQNKNNVDHLNTTRDQLYNDTIDTIKKGTQDINSETAFKTEYRPKISYKSGTPELLDPEPEDNSKKKNNSNQVKNLSVLFMYNGHDWEAHDVLGVPQGSNMHMITMNYQNLIKNSDPSSFSFYEAAYKVLSDKHRKHRL